MIIANAVKHRSRLHVYMTDDVHQTDGLEAVYRLALAMYDRDVIVDLSCIQELTAHNIDTLVATAALLRSAGHRLILQTIPDRLMTSLKRLGLSKVLNLPDACE